MSRFLPIVLISVLFSGTPAWSQTATDLSGVAFILDPGHSQNENVGIYGYSEAHKVLDVAFHLKEFLELSNADAVAMTRTDRVTSVSIAQRYNFANSYPHPNKWFHSIHSDAAAIGSPANSILILISDNCATGSGKICQSRWGNTTISMGEWQSDLMSRAYRIGTRGVYGDRTFGYQFSTSYGSAGVGVLRETAMPATLSEGGFHTNARQNLLNMNNESKRTEAKAIWLAILGHFDVERPPVRTLLGILSDSETGATLNGATATTGSQVYRTNTFEDTFKPYAGGDTTLSNGFYYFENLPGGPNLVTFSAYGYADTTIQVDIADSFFTFLDVPLLPVLPPRVIGNSPAHNATGILPNASVSLTFSRIVNRGSVESHAYLLAPDGSRVPGTFTWSSDRMVSFKPAEHLLMDTTYHFVVGVEVTDLYGRLFDGNGDGIAGDSLVITFRTRTADVVPPAILTASATEEAPVTHNHIINVTFNEPLNPATVVAGNIVMQRVGGALIGLQFEYSEAGGRGAINIYPNTPLQPGASYRIRISGVADLSGNAIPTSPPLLWQFSVAPTTFEFITIDSFSTVSGNWWQPAASGSTAGIDSATFTRDTSRVLRTTPSNSGSARLDYYWRTQASSWLIRQYLAGGPPYQVTWTKERTRLQVYLYGDGSGTLFRFAVDDNVGLYSPPRAQDHEVSEWKRIDWVGWRLVEWDLENDPVGSWIGDGVLHGTLRFDSFHLKYEPGVSAPSGRIYLNQLQLARSSLVSVEPIAGVIPTNIELHQNFPNPFNPETRIEYRIPREEFVTLTILDLLGRQIRTLVADRHTPGIYRTTWDGQDESGRSVATGVYLYRLRAGTNVLTKKMTLVK